jgi:hypothetical protein
VPQRDPLATGVTSDRQPQRGSILGRRIPQHAWQAPHECVQHRREPAPLLETRFPDGVPDVLLMHPAFGVLASHVEPDRRRLRSCPIDRHPQRGHIQAGEIRLGQFTRHLQQLDQEPGTGPPRARHPDRVLAIDGGDETGQCPNIEPGSERRVDIAIPPP